MANTPVTLRKLHKREIARLRDRCTQQARSSDKQNDLDFMQALQVNTRVDLPLGEMANPEMNGLLTVWKMTRTFVYGPITSQHQFNAQGIEGLVSIYDVPFYMALLAAIKTGLYRIDIFVPRDWTCPLLWDIAKLGEDQPTNQDDAEKEPHS